MTVKRKLRRLLLRMGWVKQSTNPADYTLVQVHGVKQPKG
jgi:hypothetical protein